MKAAVYAADGIKVTIELEEDFENEDLEKLISFDLGMLYCNVHNNILRFKKGAIKEYRILDTELIEDDKCSTERFFSILDDRSNFFKTNFFKD